MSEETKKPAKVVKLIVTNGDMFQLYEALKILKTSELPKETMVKYIPLRLKVKAFWDEYEALRKETSDATKPDGFDEVSDEEKNKLIKVWEKKIFPVLEQWSKEIATNVPETRIFSIDDSMALERSNPDKEGLSFDIVNKYFLKG